jgi:hypothetical protein
MSERDEDRYKTERSRNERERDQEARENVRRKTKRYGRGMKRNEGKREKRKELKEIKERAEMQEIKRDSHGSEEKSMNKREYDGRWLRGIVKVGENNFYFTKYRSKQK